MNEKFKYLFKNIGALFLGNFSSKILVFLLVPLYTRTLTTTEYGSYDLLNTTVQFLTPLLSFNIADAVMRFTIGASKDEQRTTFSIAVKYIIVSLILIMLGTGVTAALFPDGIVRKYFWEFILLFASYNIHRIIIQFARGLDDISGLSITGVFSTFCMIALNVLFLLCFKFGLKGYFYANILSSVFSTVFLIVRDKMPRYVRLDRNVLIRGSYEKEMIVYCVPLILNTLSWQINNMADRYAVTFFCGLAANGIYSISYKIPGVLNAVQSIFIQAWQLSSIKEHTSGSRDEFYTTIYKGVQFIMVMLCSTLIIFTKLAAKILFANEFYEAWVYVPVLTIYIVLNTLSGTVGAVFSAEKDSKTLATSAVLGAAVNIVLNIVLIYFFGVQGAAVATLISSMVIWLIRNVRARKYVNMKISYRLSALMYILLIAQAVIMINFKGAAAYLAQVPLWLALLFINYIEIRRIKDDFSTGAAKA